MAYLDLGPWIADRLGARIPDAWVGTALSVPLAVLDSLHRAGDGIYVVYRGAEPREIAAGGAYLHVRQRWAVVAVVRWNATGPANPLLWERASAWTEAILDALAGVAPAPGDPPLELVGLPESVVVDPLSPHVAALETEWRGSWWRRPS